VTIQPGAYPWGNHANAWRPRHIHFSVLGESLVHRLVTQMYFAGDPLLPLDPIFLSVPEGARERLIARFDEKTGSEGVALGYRFDMVLAGAGATPRDPG
jgi:protocatechuate 3,4-dioxygenase beta subunit